MRKFTILFALLLFAGMQVVFSQVTITGTVTLAEDESVLPGVTVFVKGTTTGTVTDIDGKYQLEVPETAKSLTFSYIGFKTIDVEIGSQKVINVSMKSDFFGLDEVIVSGVASGTQKKKMTVTVGRLGAEQLEQVPATSAAAALQGKMAGVQVTNNTGAPGQAATILLRGATSLMGSQEPMYIVDGAIIEGTLADINANDIESMEVVKGASASALYGSRAGNGVIVITTKRGKNLKLNETKVTIRNEFGANQLPKLLNLSKHHHYELKDPSNPGNLYTDFAGVTFPEGYSGGTDPAIAGGLIQSTDLYQDNEYAFLNDHQDRMFKNGNFYTNFISVANRKEKTNFYVSFENSEEEGIIELTEGFNRKNFRVNIDHYLSDKFKISASNSIGKSYTNSPGGVNNNGGIFFDVLFLWPDIDLDRHNEQDGSEYDVDAGFWNSNEDNPLYALSQRKREENRTSMIGAYSGQWYAADWLTIDAKYAFDRRNTNYTSYIPKGYLQRGGGGLVEDLGQLTVNNSSMFFQTAQVTANFNYQFNKLTTKAKLSYLYEDHHSESSNTTGYDFSVAGIPSLSAIIGEKSISSGQTDIISENFFGIFQFDYDGKYLADVMYRYDGSSLFGENERWQPYYRVSAAYRLTEDITIPGIQEFKLRAAYGTSGQRPGFSAQYETYNFVAGFPQQYTMGNKDLKPSRSTEIETGFNIEFLNRFNFEFIYSNTNTDDQIMLAILPAYYGFVKQWQNAGALESNVFEATLGAKIMKTKDFSWSATLLFDRIRQTVTELDIPPFQTGPVGQDADQVFYIREGETFGIIYGSEFLTDLDDLVPQLEDGDDISNYEINSDGYVVPYGSQGTIHEKPIKLLDENGNPAKAVIGNTNSDFHMGLSTILQYKGFSVYALLDWKNGGDVYNRTKQWLYRDLRHGDIDQFDKDPNQKKTVNYYSTLYDVNDVNSHFVEDASYLKLRELSLYYTFNKENLSNFCWGAFESIKLGFIGRNLLTFTGYSGYDPEVGQINNSIFGNAQFFSFDAYGYPNYRTYSGSLTIVF